MNKLLAGIGVMMLCADAVCSEEIIIHGIIDAYIIPDKGAVLWCTAVNPEIENMIYGIIFQDYRDSELYWWSVDFCLSGKSQENPRGYVVDIPMIPHLSEDWPFFEIGNDETSDLKNLKYNPFRKNATLLKEDMSKAEDDIWYCPVFIWREIQQDALMGIAKSLDAGNSWRLLIFWDNTVQGNFILRDYHFFTNGNGVFYLHNYEGEGSEVFYFLIDHFIYTKELREPKEDDWF